MKPPLIPLTLALTLPLAAEVTFKKQILTPDFVAEGCAVADFDHDGHLDITAGWHIWYGPDFTRHSTFRQPNENPSGPSKTPYTAATGYSDYFLQFTYDFNGDQWDDILVYGLPGEPAYLYLNPQNKGGDWPKHTLLDKADNESPDLKDINGDGKPELLLHTGGQLGYAEIDWANPTAKARFRPITPKSPENDKKYFRYTHGYGAGDVNGDNRVDILTKDGWFEQPADTKEDKDWTFHPGPFGHGGAQMFVTDVNGDGRNDVITSYEAHGYGLGWFEQKADGTFTEHQVMGAAPEENKQGVKFSQLHALALTDIDGDGIPDLVTGKRRWAHGPKDDVEPGADPVLYWFQIKPDARGGADFIPHLIDSSSGVGTQVTTRDLNKDGKPDIIVSNKTGVSVFTQR